QRSARDGVRRGVVIHPGYSRPDFDGERLPIAKLELADVDVDRPGLFTFDCQGSCEQPVLTWATERGAQVGKRPADRNAGLVVTCGLGGTYGLFVGPLQVKADVLCIRRS